MTKKKQVQSNEDFEAELRGSEIEVKVEEKKKVVETVSFDCVGIAIVPANGKFNIVKIPVDSVSGFCGKFEVIEEGIPTKLEATTRFKVGVFNLKIMDF